MSQPIALVTGTSSGFGLLATIALAKNGYHVIATMRDLNRKEALVKQMAEEKLENISLLQLDVTRPGDITVAVDRILTHHGQIDLLVNNAGYAEGGYVEDVTMDEYRRQFETNFFGLIALTKEVLPHMRKRRQGRIINISSISGRFGFPAMSAYSASKYAVEGFSESLRLEMLPYGVHVSLVEPASYQTEIWKKGLEKTRLLAQTAYPTEMSTIQRQVGRIADTGSDPQEIADLIVRVAQAPRPKLRYPIGKGVTLNLLLKQFLPWEWIEGRVSRRINKSTK